jgi:hypothetical protein
MEGTEVKLHHSWPLMPRGIEQPNEAVMLLVCVREIFSSILGRSTFCFYWSFSRFSSANSEYCRPWPLPPKPISRHSLLLSYDATCTVSIALLISYYYYSMALQPMSDLGLLLWGSVILHLYTVGRTPWTSDQPVARPLLTQDNTNTE